MASAAMEPTKHTDSHAAGHSARAAKRGHRRECITKDFRAWYTQCQRALAAKWDSIAHMSTAEKREYFAKQDVGYREIGGVAKVKYSDGCRFNEDWQLASRGSSFLHGKWVFSANKFFNVSEFSEQLGFLCEKHGETIVPMELMQTLAVQGFTFSFRPKWDGSCMHIFADATGKMHAYTLGSVNVEVKMQEHVGASPTFSQLALELVSEDMKAKFISRPYHSALFEIVSPFNVIVTKYPLKDSKGMLLPLIDIAPDGLPRESFFSDGECIRWRFEIPNYAAALAAANEAMLKHPEMFGEHPEGVVLYAHSPHGESFPLGKAKRPEYLVLHRQAAITVGSNADLCQVQELVCQGKADDLEESVRIEHANLFREALHAVAEQLNDAMTTLRGYQADPKQFALFLSISKLPRWLHSMLFEARKNNSLPAPGEAYPFLTAVLLASTKGSSITTLKVLQNNHPAGTLWFAPPEKETKPVADASASATAAAVPVDVAEAKRELTAVKLKTEQPPAPAIVPAIVRAGDAEVKGESVPAAVVVEAAAIPLQLVSQPRLVAMLRAYLDAGYPMQVYGPDMNAIERAVAEMERAGLKCDAMQAHAGDTDFLASLCKDSKLRRIVHFAANGTFLNNTALVAMGGGVRYVGVLVESVADALAISIVPPPPVNKAVVVTLVQGMASGKTQTLREVQRRLQAMGIPCSVLSFEQLHERFPGAGRDVYYGKFMEELNRAVRGGEVVCLDMCNESSDYLRHLNGLVTKGTASAVIATFMQLERRKNKLRITTAYKEFSHDQCVARLVKTGNAEEDQKALQRMLSVQDLALQQVLNKARGVQMLADKERILHPLEMADVLMALIQPKLGERVPSQGTTLGLPLHPAHIPVPQLPAGQRLTLPIVVMVPPTADVSGYAHFLGSPYRIQIGTALHSDKVEAAPVYVDAAGGGAPVPEVPYITLSVKGAASLAGMVLVAETGHTKQSQAKPETISLSSALVPL